MISAGLVGRLIFGELQLASSNSYNINRTYKTEISTVLKKESSILKLSRGDQSKFGPGPRAKADARRNFKAKEF